MRYIIILLAIVLFSSCSTDWLDIKPKGKLIPSKVEDYRMLMDQVNRVTTFGVVVSYGNVLFPTDDVTIKDDAFTNRYDLSVQNAYTWQEHFYLPEDEDKDWQALYSQINKYNLVISEVKTATGDQDDINMVYAEAKIQRAFAYFLLTNMYGKHYNASTAETDLAVPLRLDPLLSGSLERGSVAEIYKLILDDIEEVIDYLPETAEYNHRPSKASSFAFLSRVKLYMGEYGDALTAAEKSLAIYRFLYNYNDLGFESRYPNVIKMPKPFENKEVLLRKETTSRGSLIYPSSSLEQLYDITSDYRWKGMTAVESFPPRISLIYMIEYTSGRDLGLSVSEVILNKAECLAREGDYTLAIDEVNAIREKRYEAGTYTPLTAASREEAIQIVKDERRRELAFKGLRWFDLKRYNTNDNAGISLQREVNGESFTLSADSPRWVFPIGEKYISLNPEIEQNPR